VIATIFKKQGDGEISFLCFLVLHKGLFVPFEFAGIWYCRRRARSRDMYDWDIRLRALGYGVGIFYGWNHWMRITRFFFLHISVF